MSLRSFILRAVLASVADPWKFGVDPDPRINASDERIRIMLFSSLTFKMAIF
jgi:hypothetical protein